VRLEARRAGAVTVGTTTAEAVEAGRARRITSAAAGAADEEEEEEEEPVAAAVDAAGIESQLLS
jgi:hypothetical protein